MSSKVLVEHRSGVQVIDGHVKKALDLRGVQVHRQHAIGTRTSDHVGDQLGRDRHSSFVLAILSRVAEVGNDRRDARSAGSFATVNHDEQFHQIVVDRGRGRLDQKDVATANVVVDLAVVLAIGEFAQR